MTRTFQPSIVPVKYRLFASSVLACALLGVACSASQTAVPAPGPPAPSQSAAKAATSSVPQAAKSLPKGTILYARLDTAVGTGSSKVNGAIKAHVVRETMIGDSVVVPLGAVLEGKIAKLAKSTDPSTPAEMELQFTKLQLPGEKPTSISCHLSKIENARETLLADGTIVGVKGTQLPSSYLDTALTKLEQAIPSLGSTIQSIGNAQVGAPDTAISYPVGTDIEIELDKPFDVSKTYPSAVLTALAPPVLTAVGGVLRNAPQRSQTQKGVPGDPLNLVIVGSEATIQKAFKEAGWVVPAPKQKQTIWKTAQAMIKDLGYASAPISNLYLYNRPQDLAFEKMLNTFDMRHHLRLWRSGSKTADGTEIWLGAAVHDTGIDIHPGVVSHATSPNLDNERTKVGSDLMDTGLVSAEALTTRPNPLSEGFTGTGGAWHTDGKLLVVVLK